MKALKSVLSSLASLKITVAVLFACMVLVFAGTLAQREQGTWAAVAQYFRCWGTYIPLKNLVPFVAKPDSVPGAIGFAGGYSLIVVLLVNLLAAHSMRFKFVRGDFLVLPLLALAGASVYVTQQTPTGLYIALCSILGIAALALVCVYHGKRAGVIILHASLILLLCGEFITGIWQKEGQMTITEGQASNWVQDVRSVELAFVDTSDPAKDRHVVLSGPALANNQGKVIRLPELPFDVRIDKFFWNSDILGPQQAGGASPVDFGSGIGLGLKEQPRVPGTGEETDVSAGFVTPVNKQGAPIHTYLVTLPLFSSEGMLGKLNDPQPVPVDGKTYQMQLRFVRSFRPFTVKLIDFVHERHEGVDSPRSYSSRVQLIDPTHNVDREVTIRMNEPLRYNGETFFQANFQGETTTVLQVVRNPGWLVPYVACAVGALGMLLHFGTTLTKFISRRSQPVAAPPPLSGRGKRLGNEPGTISLAPTTGIYRLATKLVPAALVAVSVVGLIARASTSSSISKQAAYPPIDLTSFAEVPVSFDGRVMPLDSVARGNLKIISSRESFYAPKEKGSPDKVKVEAIEWLADVLADNERADTYEVFRLDHPQLKSLLSLPGDRKLFSWNELMDSKDNRSKLQQQIMQLPRESEKDFDDYQKAVSSLREHIFRYLRLRNAALQAALDQTLNDDQKATELVLSAIQLKVFDDPRQRGPDFTAAIFANPLLKQIDGILNELAQPAREGGQQNLVFIAPLSADEHWQPLARHSVQLLRRKVDDMAEKLVGAPQFEKIAAAFPPASQRLAEADQALGRLVGGSELKPDQKASIDAWNNMFRQLREQDPTGFNSTVQSYLGLIGRSAGDHGKPAFEASFNAFDPFTNAMVFYVAVMVFGLISFIGFTRPLLWSAISMLVIALLLQGYGLLARMIIAGRPPVINLYSSAIFIGFAASAVCLVLELIFRRGEASVVAGFIGFATGLIASALDIRDSDTMRQLVAVLDTNAWLATHVVMITLGYTASFVAGVFGVIYALRVKVSPDFDLTQRKDVYRMNYGVVCFAMFASFVGTILGGIWADQSWGRFWGWDPKENGAILIVLWNAIILHARWGGLVKERGFMALTIVGIIVTGWSWFGTNLMGIGLHSYGFIEGGVVSLLVSWAVSLLFVAALMLPMDHYKRSAMAT